MMDRKKREKNDTGKPPPPPRSRPLFHLLLAAALFVWSAPAIRADGPIFTDVSKESGLDFVHYNGMCGEYYFPEMTGQGGGFLDYDNDGDLDVYLVQGSVLGEGKTLADSLFPPKDPHPRDRLFRNDLVVNADGSRTPRFVDVTDQAGLRVVDYGMGVAAGDFNNDGWMDLYVTNFGPNRMLFNNGDGTFTDVTEKSGTGDLLWGSSASALDYDRDGWLDLYVANYVHFDIIANNRCYTKTSRRDYCGPSAFDPQPDRLFHNKGGGLFKDVTSKVLVDYTPGSGLGVVTADVNGDGWTDIYVANDGKPNQLWMNQAGAEFIDDAMFSGTSVNQDGSPEGSMGVDAGDFDRDGDDDFIVTHIMSETNTLYVNDGTGLFEDRTIALGLAGASFPWTTFGTGWIDYDNDGWLDIIVMNGAVLVVERLVLAGDPYPIHQSNQLYHNESGKKFVEVTDRAGPALALSEVSRGGAFGDVDNDGDMDVLITNNNGPARLLRNNAGHRRKWLGLRLVDPELKRDALGARAVLKRNGEPDLWRRAHTDASYCSTNDPRILFGLGDNDAVDSVEIFWPDGTSETWQKPIPMQYTTLKKGFASTENVENIENIENTENTENTEHTENTTNTENTENSQ